MLQPLIDWLDRPAFTSFGAPTTWAEVLGFVTGAWCVYLVARQHVANWPMGIANNLVWILLFASAGLYADSGLQGVYIALAVWGWWLWVRRGPQGEQRVTPTTRAEWLGLAVFGVVGTALLIWFLAGWTSSTVPFWDAVTTALSLAATYGQARRRWESWLLWMAADVIYVPLYQYKGLTLTAILYVGFFALCVKGLVDWRRSMREDRAAAAADPAATRAAEAAA